jgi:hypothetical protein
MPLFIPAKLLAVSCSIFFYFFFLSIFHRRQRVFLL